MEKFVILLQELSFVKYLKQHAPHMQLMELMLQQIKFYVKNCTLQTLLPSNAIMERLVQSAKISVVQVSQQAKVQQLVQLMDLHVHSMELHAKQR